MQNGAIGEARTKSFLIDRFWILERSVDIEGADFIIQRRLSEKSLLDERAPRLGIVQAKFFKSDKTTQYVSVSYVLDNDEKPREEFFLIAHTGDEETPRSFFLSAAIIAADFSIIEKDGKRLYSLPGRTLLAGTKYYISSKKNVLDRMERQLELADFRKNRTFLQNFEKPIVDQSAILAEYREPIPNWWGSIPETFEQLKRDTHQAMTDLETVHGLLREIANQVDPLKAMYLLENFSHYQCNAGRDWHVKLPELFNEEFVNVCREHERKVTFLTEKGLLDKFLDLPKVLKSYVVPFFMQNLPISSKSLHEFRISFSTKDLSILNVAQSVVPTTEYFNIGDALDQYGRLDLVGNPISGFKDASDGQIVYYWIPSRYASYKESATEQAKYYAEMADLQIYFECAEEMYLQLEA